jgi:integrase
MNGVKTFVVLYRVDGRLRRLTLGRYPRLSLADARGLARKALASAVRGEDPAAEKTARREAATFGEVAKEYIERHAKQHDRSWREKERMLDKDVLPAWRSMRAQDIAARDVRDLVDGIRDGIGDRRGAPIVANRTFGLIRRVFNWAAAPDRAMVPQHHNPCRGMDRPAPESQRERVLDAAEIRQVWQALDAEDVYSATIFRLLLLTAQRGGEVRTMRWDELDLSAGWWTITAERAKNGRAHRVPLVPDAVALIEALPRFEDSPGVFPSVRAAAGCRETISKAVARVREKSGVAFWPHDLRRTVATQLGSLGVARLTISKLLNHTERGVTSIYERHTYDPEKRGALNLWATRLQAIVAGESVPAKVVALRA